MDTSKQWHGGKGSKRRNSNEDAYADGWELAFGKKKPEEMAKIKKLFMETILRKLRNNF